MKQIRIGSRDSQLAILQAQMVIAAIHRFDPTIKTQLITMKTTGDKLLTMPLDKIGGKGLFVKELDEALLCDQVDITVHSYKDMPMELDSRLPVVAVSAREDPRDALLYNGITIAPTALIGCSSSRRTLQLKQLGFQAIAPLRGNVQTRLAKLDDGQYGGIVLAAAGLNRLTLQSRIQRYFSVEEMLPSACQGVLAVQGRAGEDFSFLADFNDPQAALSSLAERAFVSALGGGCSSPIAAYAQLTATQLCLTGLYVDAYNQCHKGSILGTPEQARQLGEKLAAQLKGVQP